MALPPWTEEQDAALRQMLRSGRTYAQIASAVGRTRSAVKGRVERLGLRFSDEYAAGPRVTDPWPEAAREKARQLRESGLSWGRVAEEMRASRAKTRSELDPDFREYQAMAQASYRRRRRERLGIPPKPVETRNPVYDPKRDGIPKVSLTAQLMGDPFPGRAELMRRFG